MNQKSLHPDDDVEFNQLFIYHFRPIRKCHWHPLTSYKFSQQTRYRRLWCHIKLASSWWHHQMETFSALLAICAGNSPVPGEFPAQRPVTRSFDVFFDLRLNKRLSKQSWGWWFETLSWSLWCHCNVNDICSELYQYLSEFDFSTLFYDVPGLYHITCVNIWYICMILWYCNVFYS